MYVRLLFYCSVVQKNFSMEIQSLDKLVLFDQEQQKDIQEMARLINKKNNMSSQEKKRYEIEISNIACGLLQRNHEIEKVINIIQKANSHVIEKDEDSEDERDLLLLYRNIGNDGGEKQ